MKGFLIFTFSLGITNWILVKAFLVALAYDKNFKERCLTKYAEEAGVDFKEYEKRFTKVPWEFVLVGFVPIINVLMFILFIFCDFGIEKVKKHLLEE